MRAKIVFASMTGNDEDMAEILEEGLLDQGLEVDSSDVSFTDASRLFRQRPVRLYHLHLRGRRHD